MSRRLITIGLVVAAALSPAILEGCSTFGAEEPASSDEKDGGIDSGRAEDAAPAGDQLASGPAFVCPDPPEPDVVFCADFEGASLPDETRQDDPGIAEIVDGFGGSGRAFHALMGATSKATGLLAGFGVPIGDQAHVAIEADVYVGASIDSALTEEQGEFGFLSVTRGDNSTEWTATLFLETEELLLTTYTPAFEGARPARRAISPGKWMHVRFDVDHKNARYSVLLGDAWRGTSRPPPESVLEDQANAGQAASPAATKPFIGIMRYNQQTPKLEIFYDYVVIRRVSP